MEIEAGSRHSSRHRRTRHKASRSAVRGPSPAGPAAAFFAALLFVLLAAFTATVTDNSEVCTRWIGAGVFLLAAVWMAVDYRQHLEWSLPSVCLLLMACYGVCQTLWFPQKILSEGWRITTFWGTCAIICVLAHQLFRDPTLARQFRLAFVYFASAICILDLVQQGTQTQKVLWTFPSTAGPFGTFQYYNNFSQFVELAVPVTLWFALARRHVSIFHLLLAALQISAVIASGSRAGSILVIVEFLGILCVSWFRGRSRLSLPVLGIALVLTCGFIAVAGFEQVKNKLSGPDLLLSRSIINETSIDMIKAHPWTGWGLGTYVPVYPQFARYDDGTYMNHAHNDWLEWAAEGGVFFAGLMLVVFLWTLWPAWRSLWGLGLVFICIHALVDYPFARLGVCGWYFALLGMLAGHREEKHAHHHHRSEGGEEEPECLSVHEESAGLQV
jgi:O-antigen ligase